MKVDQQVLRIVAEVLGVHAEDVDVDLPLRDWGQVCRINDETCMVLNINIGTQLASQCRTVGDYLRLVRSAA
ncbi:acyl carrier protein [Lampropedia cohaerens]|nr:acyl carrier protein [Lampropedia cohaerens]